MTKLYRQNPTHPATVVGGEAAIVTSGDARLHILNPVGTRIWELCAEPGRTTAGIVEVLLSEFDVDRAVANDETRRFLSEALSVGLIVEDHEPSPQP